MSFKKIQEIVKKMDTNSWKIKPLCETNISCETNIITYEINTQFTNQIILESNDIIPYESFAAVGELLMRESQNIFEKKILYNKKKFINYHNIWVYIFNCYKIY
jgi:hypothetical protein